MIKVKFTKTNNPKLSTLWFADRLESKNKRGWRSYYGFTGRAKVFYKKA